MEEESSSRCSVAELAGRFKGSAPAHDAAGQETEKPVRRRPPRSLQLPKTQTDDQEPPAGVTSPLPAKAKRNSALIEKLQANLALSPTALLPSPKSPGFRLLPPAFPSPSSGSAPSTTATSMPSTPTPITPVIPSPSAEEGPASFEAPPTAAEGTILSNINKGRARHSLRRRPPSRRHRKSSSEDDISTTTDGETLSSQKDETKEEEKKEEEEVKEEKTETQNETREEERSEVNAKPKEEEKKEEEEEGGSVNKEEGDSSSSGGVKEEEKKQEEEKQEEESTEGTTEEEKSEQGAECQSPTS